MTLRNLLQTILGIGEEIVPIFIHNPTSKNIEAVIVTTASGAMEALSPAPKNPAG